MNCEDTRVTAHRTYVVLNFDYEYESAHTQHWSICDVHPQPIIEFVNQNKVMSK